MSEEHAVLRANAEFYAAFARGDVAAMESLWSSERPVACVHPGWNALTDRAGVMASWQGILRNPSAPDVRCVNPTAYIAGTCAFVVCYEVVDGRPLVATNIFIKESRDWKMVHHHAGHTVQATVADPAPDGGPAPARGGTIH